MKVLFPVDGSNRSLETIRQASKLLDKANTEVYLFTVITPILTDIPIVAVEPDTQIAMGILDAAQVVAQAEGFKIDSRKFISDYSPANAICNYATEMAIDQIIIGSHGYQGLSKFLLGSVSEEVLKKAEQPVILIRNDKNQTVNISHFEQAKLQQTK